MKKFKFLIIPAVAFMFIFGLASCSNGVTITDSTEESSSTGNDVDKTSEETEGGSSSTETGNEATNATNPADINATYDDTASVVSAVETAVEKVYDSVVAITITTQSGSAAGSGVLFAKNESLNLSYIVTCFHVIEGATSINITYNVDGGTEIKKASVVGVYSDNDVAILSVEGTNHTYASFYSNSDSLKLGSTVIAIGNPLGTLPGTVSTGVVSYVNRTITVDSTTGQTMNLIQTDVAINSGNSGGGLFNSSGNLIGIVNAKYSSSSIEGLSFAIPVNTVKDVISSVNQTAKYDTDAKAWSCGYYVGDWELGFTVSTYTQQSGWTFKNVAGISAISSNQTASGSTLFDLREIIQTVAIDYLDESKTDIQAQAVSSATLFYSLIYGSDLSIGDKIIIVNGNSETKTVELVQYIYS